MSCSYLLFARYVLFTLLCLLLLKASHESSEVTGDPEDFLDVTDSVSTSKVGLDVEQARNHAVVHSAPSAPVLVSLLDGRIVALNGEDGSVRWTLQTGSPLVGTWRSEDSQGACFNHSMPDGYTNCKDPEAAITSNVFPGLDGSLFTVEGGNGRSGVEKLPLTVQQLVEESPSITKDGHLLMGTRRTSVFIVDAETGNIVRSFWDHEGEPKGVTDETDSDVLSTLPKGNYVTITRRDFSVQLLDLHSSAQHWNLSFGMVQQLSSTPLHSALGTNQDEGMPLIGVQENMVHQFNGGELEWSVGFDTPLAYLLSPGATPKPHEAAAKLPLPPGHTGATRQSPPRQFIVGQYGNHKYALPISGPEASGPKALPSAVMPLSDGSSIPGTAALPFELITVDPLTDGESDLFCPNNNPNDLTDIGAGGILPLPGPALKPAEGTSQRPQQGAPTPNSIIHVVNIAREQPLVLLLVLLATGVGMCSALFLMVLLMQKRAAWNDGMMAPHPADATSEKSRQMNSQLGDKSPVSHQGRQRTAGSRHPDGRRTPRVPMSNRMKGRLQFNDNTAEDTARVTGSTQDGSGGRSQDSSYDFVGGQSSDSTQDGAGGRSSDSRQQADVGCQSGNSVIDVGPIHSPPLPPSQMPRLQVKQREMRDGVAHIGKLEVSPTILGYGSGGTIVFEGKFNGRRVAVKRLLRQLYSLAHKEISALILSDEHPNIVRCYALEEDEEFVYLALERCCRPLSDISTDVALADMMVDGSGVPTKHGMQVAHDISAGLAALHSRGIVHRDLKPHNVLLTDSDRAKLSDMGLSKKLGGEDTSFESLGAGGSSGWQSPEQLVSRSGGAVRQGRSTDVFSLALVLHYVLTKGNHPFGQKYERDANILAGRYNLSELAHLPEFANLISAMLNHKPKQRPSMASVMAHPAWWSSTDRLAFLINLSDRMENEDREADQSLLVALESYSSCAVAGNWAQRFDGYFLSHLGKYRKYNPCSLRDLLRVIRNKHNHFRELPSQLQQQMSPVPSGFLSYFTSRFPNLMMCAVCFVVRHCSTEAHFQKYVPKALLDYHFDRIFMDENGLKTNSQRSPLTSVNTNTTPNLSPTISSTHTTPDKPAPPPPQPPAPRPPVAPFSNHGQPDTMNDSHLQQLLNSFLDPVQQLPESLSEAGAAVGGSNGMGMFLFGSGGTGDIEIRPGPLGGGTGVWINPHASEATRQSQNEDNSLFSIGHILPAETPGVASNGNGVGMGWGPVGGEKGTSPPGAEPPAPPAASHSGPTIIDSQGHLVPNPFTSTPLSLPASRYLTGSGAAACLPPLMAGHDTDGEHYIPLLPQRAGEALCDFFVKTGHCKFGRQCVFNHPPLHAVRLNRDMLPLRPGQLLCSFYQRFGMCKFGASCKFHHPNFPPGHCFTEPNPRILEGLAEQWSTST